MKQTMRLTRRGKLVLAILIILIAAIPISFTYKAMLKEGERLSSEAEQPPYEDSTEVPEKAAYVDVMSDAEQKDEPEETPELVPYDGKLEHIFFHPLIAYPELAFDGDRMSKGYDDWFVTVDEFNRILESLYDKNFILVDINSIYDEGLVDGRKLLEKKPLMLPKGKKPLIISVDDVNYYEYMKKNGNVHKLVLGEDDSIYTYSTTPDGKEIYSKEDDIVPILDEFIKKHPDFSHNGAKGILALTGYEGILGYDTHKLDSSEYEGERTRAAAVVNKLKETGWSFACHSYGHRDADKISYSKFVQDTERWKTEVEPLIGATNVYIYPYGSRVPDTGSKYGYLIDSGFNIICAVGDTTYSKFAGQSIQMDRRHIDGIAFKQQRGKYLDLFDSKDIIDSVRPK